MSLVTSELVQPLLNLPPYTLSREDTQSPARAAVVAPQWAQPCPQLCHDDGPWHHFGDPPEHVCQRWGRVLPATVSSRRQEQHPCSFTCTPESHPPVLAPRPQVSTRASQLTPTAARPNSCLTHRLEQEWHKWRGFFVSILALGLDIPKLLPNNEIPAAMTEDHAVCLAH